MYMTGSLFAINNCNALPMFSLRDASCNVIDIGNLIMCRTLGSVIVVLFPICSFARNHEPYSLRLSSRFYVYVKVIVAPRSTKRTVQVGLCQTCGYFNQTQRSPCAPFDGKRRSLRHRPYGAKSASSFGYRKSQIERKEF